MRRKLLAIGLATFLAVGVANISYGDETTYIPSTIDSKQAISLTVHKYTAPAGDTDSGGKSTESTPEGAEMIDGVEFTWQRVTPSQIDLTTNAGWVEAGKIAKKFNLKHDPAELKKGEEKLTFDKTGNGTTTNGKIKFDLGKGNDAIGLYLITETDASKAKVNGKPVNVTPALPFLVTLPMTDPAQGTNMEEPRTRWNYDVHVYPKNAVTKITKEVEDKMTITGKASETNKSQIAYWINADIPLRTGAKPAGLGKSAPLEKYVILDKTDPAKATIVDEEVSVEYCKPSDDPSSPDCEDADDTEYDKSTENGLLKISFKDMGLQKLVDKRDEAENAENGVSKQAFVRVYLPVKPVAIPAGATTSDLENTAYLVPDNNHSENLPPDPNNPSVPGEEEPGKIPPIPSNKVSSKFAKVKLKKVDEEGQGLGGAEFQLFTCQYEMKDGKVTISGQPSSVRLKDNKFVKATSNSAGEVVFEDQVRVSDFSGNKEITNEEEGYIQYCVKETKAPEGYELTPEFLPVDLKASEVAAGIWTMPENVVNVKKNAGFKLPFTGSAASISLMLAAVALMGGAIVLASRRRSEES